jgi:hypothetical protein
MPQSGEEQVVYGFFGNCKLRTARNVVRPEPQRFIACTAVVNRDELRQILVDDGFRDCKPMNCHPIIAEAGARGDPAKSEICDRDAKARIRAEAFRTKFGGRHDSQANCFDRAGQCPGLA